MRVFSNRASCLFPTRVGHVPYLFGCPLARSGLNWLAVAARAARGGALVTRLRFLLPGCALMREPPGTWRLRAEIAAWLALAPSAFLQLIVWVWMQEFLKS